MLIEVHYGEDKVLLVNGNCRPIHLLNYIRTHCSISESKRIDLCAINTGEPFQLSPSDTKLVSSEQLCLPLHVHCVLIEINSDGACIPLSNDPTLITHEFLTKLKRATGSKVVSNQTIRPAKHSANSSDESGKRKQYLKSVVIAASMMKKK
ncbi:unnamed protein product [Rotaria sp. Silwood2]|nr:unnamed protein product [Rotaria sp. Silwood2]CAF3086088.1 unnamed protein product [Rotaria sp. Silwood2]CAF3364938.1 unnamed protein product [Rotaria sp. Silwood2]CAF3407955.1 unnamed protein product [Rotaria sp. Silwood2]CAF4365686.1 unnamed protein product [Rotaria sp. Silwood2]